MAAEEVFRQILMKRKESIKHKHFYIFVAFLLITTSLLITGSI